MKLQKNNPPLKLGVFVDDITALSMWKNEEVTEMANKVMRMLKEEVEKMGLIEVVDLGEGEGMKEKGDCFVWLFGRKVT